MSEAPTRHASLDFPVREGNRLECLKNGDEIFPAMLEAMRAAKHSISLETYIYWSGAIAVEVAETLAEAARRGVEVRAVLDWFGCSKMDDELVEMMKEAGVRVLHYRPLRWWNLRRANCRSHRKLLIVDGVIGFTGGVGIADEWTGDAEDPRHWRDNHYRVEGPVVGDMQRVFFDHWDEEAPRGGNGRLFPELEEAGDLPVQLIASTPLMGPERFAKIYSELMEEAEERFWVISPYFAPDDPLLAKLMETARRGVDVRVVTAGKHNDFKVVRRASRHDWGPLLEAGVKIFEYHPTLIHVKLLIVDRGTSLFGSANFDARSVRLNDEASLLVRDERFTAEQAELFEGDLRIAEEITFEQWRNRPWKQRTKDRAAHLLRPLL